MRDVSEAPHGARVGLMGWPYPGHGGTLWREFVLAEGLQPTVALDDQRALAAAWEDRYQEVKAVVLEQLRLDFPVLSRWAESVDWLQECGRGDVVAVMSFHTGAVLSHCCLAWRDDYRDESKVLWGWDWVIAAPNPLRLGEMLETRADASGCILDKRGNPTSKVLVRPTVGTDERDGILARWQSCVAGMLLEVPPVRTVPLCTEEADWDVYDKSMAETFAAVNDGSLECRLSAEIDAKAWVVSR